MSINYRKDQKKIMRYKSGSMGIQAVPGAGKTFIITNLVAQLIEDMENENRDGKILVLTYMNSAVNNFKSRIRGILSDKDLPKSRFEVMTIHSLAMKIIKENTDIAFVSEETEIIDDYKKSLLINSAIEEYESRDNNSNKILSFMEKGFRNNEDKVDRWYKEFTFMVLNSIKLLKYSGIDDIDLKNIVNEPDYKGIMTIISPIFNLYQEKLRSNAYIDYDDILVMAYKILESDSEVAAYYQERYAYVFEDECQDSNEIQGKIIEIISRNVSRSISENDMVSAKMNLVRVGDVNQSITTTFAGSNPKFFVDFCKRADKSYTMNMAGRSSKDIINTANKLVEIVKSDMTKDYYGGLEEIYIEEVEKDKGYKENPVTRSYSINSKSLDDFNQEMDYVVSTIKYTREKFPNYSIGVLYFSNFDVNDLAKKLDSEDIPYEKIGNDSQENMKIIYKIKLVVDFIIDPSDYDIFKQMLFEAYIDRADTYELSDIEHERLEKLFDKIDTERYFYDDLYFDDLATRAKQLLENLIEKPFVKKLAEDRARIRSVLEYSKVDIYGLIKLIGDSLNISSQEKSLIDYLAFYLSKLKTYESADLNRISIAMAPRNTRIFETLVASIYDIGEHEVEAGSISISTMHKSKGMEWDLVIVCGVSSNDFPSSVNDYFRIDRKYLREGFKYPEAFVNKEIDDIVNKSCKKIGYYEKELKTEIIGERTRLLYVAITRAKRGLVILNSRSKFNESMNYYFKKKNSYFFDILSKYISDNRIKGGK